MLRSDNLESSLIFQVSPKPELRHLKYNMEQIPEVSIVEFKLSQFFQLENLHIIGVSAIRTWLTSRGLT